MLISCSLHICNTDSLEPQFLKQLLKNFKYGSGFHKKINHIYGPTKALLALVGPVS